MTVFVFTPRFPEHGKTSRRKASYREAQKAEGLMHTSSHALARAGKSDILIFVRLADLQYIADVRQEEYPLSTNGYIRTKSMLTTDIMFLVFDVRRGRYLKDLRGVEARAAGD